MTKRKIDAGIISKYGLVIATCAMIGNFKSVGAIVLVITLLVSFVSVLSDSFTFLKSILPVKKESDQAVKDAK